MVVCGGAQFADYQAERRARQQDNRWLLVGQRSSSIPYRLSNSTAPELPFCSAKRACRQAAA